MKLGFSGTREGCTHAQRLSLGRLLRVLFGRHEGISEAHHGCAVGADADFALMLRGFFVRQVGHPSNIPEMTSQAAVGCCSLIRDPLPPLTRNADIVAESDALIACPKEGEEVVRSGTWSTVRRARKKGITVWIVEPSGTVRKDRQ